MTMLLLVMVMMMDTVIIADVMLLVNGQARSSEQISKVAFVPISELTKSGMWTFR